MAMIIGALAYASPAASGSGVGSWGLGPGGGWFDPGSSKLLQGLLTDKLAVALACLTCCRCVTV